MPYPNLEDLRRHAETMLFRVPGPHLHDSGARYDYTVVPSAQVSALLADGWALTVEEATAKAEKPKGEKPAGGLTAVHKGRGVWEVQDAEGNTVESGLTKEQAQAKAA